MFGFRLDTERAFGHPRSMTRTYVRRRRTTLIVVLGLLTAVLYGPVAGAVAGQRVPSATPQTYIVATGDTLWGIASRLRPGTDPRPIIQQIQQLNGVEAGSLAPGQRLLIPVAD
jgi:hypothetical protein